MLKRLFFVWLLLFSAARAAFEIKIANPAAIARGGIISLFPGGTNPAILIKDKGFQCGLNYSNLYGIKNLTIWDANLQYTTRSRAGIALHITTLGNAIYQEKSVGFSYARHLSSLISAGITVNYYDLTITGYQTTGAFGLNFGTSFYPDSNLGFSLSFENINAPKICNGQEELPQTFAFGWQWRPLQRGELSAEIFKDTRRPFIFRSGIRIGIVRGFNLLAGIQLNPDRLSGGFELTWHQIQMALAIQHHPILPSTLYYGCGLNF